MITFLRRLFIKDYQNVNDENVRRAHGVFGAIFGIVTNILIAGLKVGAAIFLASKASWVFPVALIADAVNNISDIASSIVTLIGFKLADKPADKEHPFGHQRIEYIAGLFVAILILVAGYELLKESIESVIAFHSSGTHSSYDLLACIILGVSILLKFFQSMVNRGLGKAINSPTLLAVSLDSLMDCLTTSSVLLSAILMLTLGWNFMDGYIGILVSHHKTHSLLYDSHQHCVVHASGPELWHASVPAVKSWYPASKPFGKPHMGDADGHFRIRLEIVRVYPYHPVCCGARRFAVPL